jgi:hypothetical protein
MIPAQNSPSASYTAFLTERQNLIREERSLRRDQQPQIRQISATEVKADEIVRRMREEEARTLWGAVQQHSGGSSDSLFPGMGFLTGKFLFLMVFRFLSWLEIRGLCCGAGTDIDRICS